MDAHPAETETRPGVANVRSDVVDDRPNVPKVVEVILKLQRPSLKLQRLILNEVTEAH
jgi:hypothetical protein